MIITGTDPGRGAQVVDDVRAGAAGTVRFVPADLADPQAVQRLAEDAGAVDILVNNAGVVPFSATAAQDLAGNDAAFAVNVRVNAVLPGSMTPPPRWWRPWARTSAAWG